MEAAARMAYMKGMSPALRPRRTHQPRRGLAAAGTAICVVFTVAATMAMAAASPAQAACGGRVQTGYNQSALALSSRCGTTLRDLRLANPGVDFNKPLNNRLIRVPQPGRNATIPEELRTPAPGRPRLLPPVSRSHRPVDPQVMEDARRRGQIGERATYRIRPGDTLSAIAARRGLALEALIAANPGIAPRRLAVGQTIVIPR